MGENICDTWLRKDFLGYKTWTVSEKWQTEYHQIQNVCSSKDTVMKMRKQAKSWLKK